MTDAKALLGIPLFAWYPILAVGFFTIMVILIPRKYIRDLFLDGLIMGTVLSWIVAVVNQGLGLFKYENLGPFHFVNSPVWLHLAWASAVVIFVYFKPPQEQPLKLWTYILAFSFLSAMLDAVLNHMGLLSYYHWSPLARFIIVIPWFWSIVWFNSRYVEEHRTHT